MVNPLNPMGGSIGAPGGPPMGGNQMGALPIGGGMG